MLVDKVSSLELPLRGHAELKRDNIHVISVATPKINALLGINMEVPPLVVKYDNGSAAEVETVDHKQTIVLRPLKRIEEGKKYYFPAEVTVHELAHIAVDKFLDLPQGSKTMQVIYFNEGLADYIAADDPAGVYRLLGIDNPKGSYERLRQEIENGTIFGNTLLEFFSLDKLFCTKQIDLFSKSPTEVEDAKSFVPYWIGSSLVRFIVERGGIESLQEIMRKVQIQKKFGLETASYSNLTLELLRQEEVRVNALLKSAISEKFGDISIFEANWKKAVLGE